MSKNKQFTYVNMSWFTFDRVPKQILAHQKQKNMDSYSKLSKNCKEF
jgi:hypothetical protein